MKQSMLEQLWNGQIAPYQNCGRGDPELEELAQLMERNKAALDDEIGDKQKGLLKAYIACCDEYAYLTTVHAFRQGFSLAGKLLTEALADVSG